MFFKRTTEEDKDAIEMVTCCECKAQVLKEDVKVVRYYAVFALDREYCGKCKPPYDKIDLDGNTLRYFKTNQTIEVNEDGSEIKAKK
jgi:hypothetical protein